MPVPIASFGASTASSLSKNSVAPIPSTTASCPCSVAISVRRALLSAAPSAPFFPRPAESPRNGFARSHSATAPLTTPIVILHISAPSAVHLEPPDFFPLSSMPTT